jgi:hypothetical protein
MYGRRRPQRERVLSETCPMIGSVNASQKRGAIWATPTRIALTPRPTLRINPESCPTELNRAIGTNPPIP